MEKSIPTQNEEKTGQSNRSKKKAIYNTTPIRVRKATSRSIRTLLNKLNRKSLGRKVAADDLISKALDLLTEGHLEAIQKATYSSKDHLELQYQEYCKVNGQITKERFLEMLLSAGLPILQSNSKRDI